ncbi:hypothetical protein [Streptomyces sp. DHE17-7]|uniref:hypothetical protein n=1 Tax=Streptomyces sp. DHE17-7 TaxID=2759949 RepID=UPI0022EAECE2|nr:hypothetical protein [Streptomyces sp. DHE17-7]MBJ6621830.1 hypothetical protein [Streptomyces sp. DHE17-7]
MDAFTAGLLQRIKTTESDLSRARDEGDEFLVEVELGELDDLRRLAAEHGVEVARPASDQPVDDGAPAGSSAGAAVQCKSPPTAPLGRTGGEAQERLVTAGVPGTALERST